MNQQNLNLRLSIQMAAPHTWPAAIVPVLFSGAVVLRKENTVDYLLWIVLMMICILMQSAANIFNDYFDLLKGTDSKEDYVEKDDAVLVHHPIPPIQAFFLGCSTVVLSLILGIYPILRGGTVILVIGIIGILVLFFYSGGKMPISSLPIGELAAGLTMGGLIPLACTTALTGRIEYGILWKSLPITLGIALMMMTNNICDIEKDLRVSRKTFPARMGRKKSRVIYRIFLVLWLVLMTLLMLFYYFPVNSINLFCLFLCFIFGSKAVKTLIRQYNYDLEPFHRPVTMKTIASLNAFMGLTYTFWILL